MLLQSLGSWEALKPQIRTSKTLLVSPNFFIPWIYQCQ
ncbi:hypothetical protein RintRC_1722 [Richelia intracellularis]|nr:hypothetical protein RintRC_1722 [Richelia intracellularis]